MIISSSWFFWRIGSLWACHQSNETKWEATVRGTRKEFGYCNCSKFMKIVKFISFLFSIYLLLHNTFRLIPIWVCYVVRSLGYFLGFNFWASRDIMFGNINWPFCRVSDLSSVLEIGHYLHLDWWLLNVFSLF